MYYDYGWRPYVTVAERRRKAAREMEKLKKKGHPVSPVVIEGRTIARTFWGKAWCENLERYSDYENRLPRGRTYVRNGSVVDLQIGGGNRQRNSCRIALLASIACGPWPSRRLACHSCGRRYNFHRQLRASTICQV